MRFKKSMILIAGLFVCSSFSNNFTKLSNDNLSVSIVTDADDPDFGAIASLQSKDANQSVSDIRLFTMMCGSTGAQNKRKIYSSADSLQIELSEFGKYPLTAIVNYKLDYEILRVSVKCHTARTTEFDKGLSLTFSDPNKTFTGVKSGATGFKPVYINLESDTVQATNLDNYTDFYKVRSDKKDTAIHLTCSMINPFHSLWQFNSRGPGNHQLDILTVVKPYSPAFDTSEIGPPAACVIAAADTIYRDITVSMKQSDGPHIAISEHVNGFAPAITMYWDELPNRDNWNYMTTSDAKDVVYDHFWVRLLEEHPGLKMGYLLLLERMLFRDWTSFPDWRLNTVFILADSLEPHSGTYCAYMESKDTTLTISQSFKCRQSASYTFSYWMKTEGVTGGGAYGEVYSENTGRLIVSDEQKNGNTEWKKYSLTFNTEELDSGLVIFLRLQNGKGKVFFDDVKMVCMYDTTVNLVKNPGFEDCTPGFIYQDKRRHWADITGLESVVNKATEPYKEFLRRIENDENKYGWESRVRLGSHGYHHTPSIFQPDLPSPGWEFQYYDTTGDRLRIQRLFEGTEKIGLTKKSLRFWRSAGCMYTASLVNLITDSGFVFLGRGTTGNFSCIPLQREKNRLWVNSNVFWADKEQGNSVEPLYSILENGHMCQLGGHPEAIFQDATEESYQKFSGLFTDIESKFDNLGYVFPDEYSDNANAAYNLHDCIDEQIESTQYLHFRGEIKEGVSVVLQGNCTSVTLDNKKISFKKSGNMTYVVLPSRPDTLHTLAFYDVKLNKSGVVVRNKDNVRYQLVSGRNIYKIKTAAVSDVRAEMFSLNGKMVLRKESTIKKNKLFILNINDANISGGVYLLRFFINGKQVRSMSVNYSRH